MAFSALALRRTSVAAAVLLAVMAAMWWLLWMLAAGQYKGVIDNWITAGRAQGYKIDFDDRAMFGFPHHVVLRFKNMRWSDANGISFHADQMDLSATPWSWQVFGANLRGHVELSAPLDADGRRLSLGCEQGRAHVELDENGIWKLSRVSLSHAHLGRAPDMLFIADILKASAVRPEQPPRDHKQAGLTLEGEAENLVLPQSMDMPFGPKMRKLGLSLRVMGEMPDFRREASVAAWNAALGVVQFDRLNMEWGPLGLTAKGTLGFDDDLQPEGAFTSAIAHHEAVLKVLMERDLIPPRQAAMLNSALSLFAKPSDDAPGIEVPITVQLGGLYLGPVKIFNFPAIEWPKADEPAPATSGTGVRN